MHWQRRINDPGLNKAIRAGIGSPHPYSRAVIGNYERYNRVSSRSGDTDYWTEGEIPVGFIADGSAPRGTILRLKKTAIRKNCVLIGASGLGKTNCVRIIVDGLRENKIPLTIFDPTGDHINAYRKKNPIIFPIKNLRINPNQEPPGVPYDDWVEVYIPALLRTLILTDVSKGSFTQLNK